MVAKIGKFFFTLVTPRRVTRLMAVRAQARVIPCEAKKYIDKCRSNDYK